jgi:aminoglycoside 3-N-acetyltransferase
MVKTSSEKLDSLWGELGIREGDQVMCHSFLPSLGLLEGGGAAVVQSLRKATGDSGNLVFPSFTYSYCEGQIFNWNYSRSAVGVLGDLAKEFPGSERSLDPNFSMVCLGPDSRELMERSSKHSFGQDSIYHRLFLRNFKMLFLGVDFTALSLFMHLEKLIGVSYRYDKKFSGKTIKDQRSFPDEAIHFVRNLETRFSSDRRPIGEVLARHPQCRRAFCGFRSHWCMPALAIGDLVFDKVRQNPYFLIKMGKAL